jgi:hypothetical protein
MYAVPLSLSFISKLDDRHLGFGGDVLRTVDMMPIHGLGFVESGLLTLNFGSGGSRAAAIFVDAPFGGISPILFPA